MGKRSHGAGVERVKARFASWRKKRVRGERIPTGLWDAAAKVAADVGVCQTAKALQLDYYALQRRVKKRAPESAPPAFVELPTSPHSASECVIELEDTTGVSMKMHLKSVDASTIASLSHSLWKAK